MPTLRTLLPVLLLAIAGSAPAWAAPAVWRLDPVHTRIAFTVDHAGFSSAIGTFSGASGTLVFDPDDLASARLEVQVPLATLDLGDDRWNRATLARRLLDAETHPVAGFRSLRVEPVGERGMAVHGLLTLRGVTRETRLDVAVNAVKRHPLPPFRRTAGFSATATLRRSDFGIDAWPSMVGDEVALRIEAEAVLSGRGDRTDAAADDTGGEAADAAPLPRSDTSPPPDPDTPA